MTDTTAPEKKNIDLNMVDLVDLTAKIFHQVFIKQPKDKAKAAFKEIKGGKAITLGTATLAKEIESTLKLNLDYSEFVGPGFNFDVFLLALHAMLQRISDTFKKQGDLNLLPSEDNQMLVHLPGAISVGGQVNVLVMAYDFGTLEAITIKLMFVDPSQYDGLIKGSE